MTREQEIKVAVDFLKSKNLTKTQIKDYQYVENLVYDFIIETKIELTDPIICDVIVEFQEQN
jgi:hypothetical protein